jgi:hypothetical protein
LSKKVFEVNSSQLRAKSHIIQELEGALNSHHVSNDNNSTRSESAINKCFNIARTDGEITTNSNKESEASFKINNFFKKNPVAPLNVNKGKVEEQVIAIKRKGRPRKSEITKLIVSPLVDTNSCYSTDEDSENTSDTNRNTSSDGRKKIKKKKRLSLRKETVLSIHQQAKIESRIVLADQV